MRLPEGCSSQPFNSGLVEHEVTVEYTCGEQRRTVWQEAETCQCWCSDGQWSYGSKCDQDHIRKCSSKEHPYLEISLEGEHWVDLEVIFGIYEETRTESRKPFFTRCFYMKYHCRKMSIRLRYKEVLERQ